MLSYELNTTCFDQLFLSFTTVVLLRYFFRSTRSPAKYEEDESTAMSSSCGTCTACDTCGVTVALTVAPLALITYHDWKIGVTTLVVVVVLATLRRIFRMIIAGEEACALAEEKEN